MVAGEVGEEVEAEDLPAGAGPYVVDVQQRERGGPCRAPSPAISRSELIPAPRLDQIIEPDRPAHRVEIAHYKVDGKTILGRLPQVAARSWSIGVPAIG